MRAWKKNEEEIFWNVINSALAGILVFLGSIASTETITIRGITAGLIVSLIAIVTKFRDYWSTQEREYCDKKGIVRLFDFI